MTTRVVAVDGGQSGIRLLDNRGSLTRELPGVSRLEGDPLTTIARAVAGALEGQSGEPIDTLVFGLSTVPETPEEARAFAQAIATQIPARRIIVTDDAVAHHAALFGSTPGIALAIGTGVACTAVGTDQGFYSVSGYGFLLGDDGGAFWLGREAIRVVLDARYRSPQTPLATLIGTEFGDLGSLPALIHSRDRAVNDVAHLAPQILALAHTDPQAQSVVEAALQCLAEAVSRAQQSAPGLDKPRVQWTSKLFSADPVWATKLSATLQQAAPGGEVERSEALPLAGALWLGETSDCGAYGPYLVEFENTEGIINVS
jgi:N-acetylglucosamine kinase-like BadF-type ATPase